jgi:hypothetical protein
LYAQVDLMNGQRTGGEHLPPVECSTTGHTFNAAGIAAFLSKDRLAGSIPAASGECRKPGSSKKANKINRKRVEKVAEAAAAVLVANSWAVVDNFVPRSSVEAIRKEVQVMEACYDPGEIWVGASNEVRCLLWPSACSRPAWLSTHVVSFMDKGHAMEHGLCRSCGSCMHCL